MSHHKQAIEKTKIIKKWLYHFSGHEIQKSFPRTLRGLEVRNQIYHTGRESHIPEMRLTIGLIHIVSSSKISFK